MWVSSYTHARYLTVRLEMTGLGHVARPLPITGPRIAPSASRMMWSTKTNELPDGLNLLATSTM